MLQAGGIDADARVQRTGPAKASRPPGTDGGGLRNVLGAPSRARGGAPVQARTP
jgi:hypothetical protein